MTESHSQVSDCIIVRVESELCGMIRSFVVAGAWEEVINSSHQREKGRIGGTNLHRIIGWKLLRPGEVKGISESV